MLKSLSVLCLLAGAAFAQSFPSSIFTPYVSADNIATTLSTSMLSSDTSAFVASNTGFVANMLAYICDSTTSTTKCTGTFEVMLVTGTSGANVINVTRAQGGTSAVAHAAGATLSNAPVALYNTSLNNEVHAVETALGANLANLPQAVDVSSKAYNFSAITPGGSLTGAGGNQVVNIPVCPPGLVFTGNTATSVYLSGETGTAEAVRLTGGNCPAGSSGTMIVAPAHNHSGAWTITSATAGIDLACNSNAYGAHVRIPPGVYSIYGTIRVPDSCTIDGGTFPSNAGPTSSVILELMTGGGIPLIDIVGRGTTVENVMLSFGTPASGLVGGSPAASGAFGVGGGITAGLDTPLIRNVLVWNFYNDFYFTNGAVNADHNWGSNSVSDTFYFATLGSGYVHDCYAFTSGANGFTINAADQLQWTDNTAYNNNGFGVKINGPTFQMEDWDTEDDYNGEELISGANGVSYIEDWLIGGGGRTASWGQNNTAPCFYATSALNITITGMMVSNCNGNGIQLDGSDITLIGGVGGAVGLAGGAPSVGACCIIESTGAYVTVTGFQAEDSPSSFTGPAYNITGNNFVNFASGDTASMVTLGATFTDGVFCNNTIDNQYGGAITYTSGATGIFCQNSVRGTITGTLGLSSRATPTIAAGTASATSGAATLNTPNGTVTSETLSTAAGSTYTLTLTDSTIAATSVVMASVQLGSSTTGTPQIVSVTPGSGSVVVVVKNIHASAAFNGTIKISFSQPQ